MKLTKRKPTFSDTTLPAALKDEIARAVEIAVKRGVAAALMVGAGEAPQGSASQAAADRQIGGRRFVDMTQACNLLGCSRTTIYRMMADGTLKPHKLGAKNRFRIQDIEALLG